MFTYKDENHTLEVNGTEVLVNIRVSQSGYKNGDIGTYISCFSKEKNSDSFSNGHNDYINRFNVRPYTRISDAIIVNQTQWLEDNREMIMQKVQEHYS